MENLRGIHISPDTFDFSKYAKVSADYHKKDEQNPYDFTVEKYERKEKQKP